MPSQIPAMSEEIIENYNHYQFNQNNKTPSSKHQHHHQQDNFPSSPDLVVDTNYFEQDTENKISNELESSGNQIYSRPSLSFSEAHTYSRNSTASLSSHVDDVSASLRDVLIFGIEFTKYKHRRGQIRLL